MPEVSTEEPIRLGPTAANLLKAIWRQKELVAVGLLLGLALGYLVLPKVFGSGSTYQATIRMDVRQTPADTIQKVPPAINPGDESGAGAAGASPDVLKDYQVAEFVVKQLRIQDELPATALLNMLVVTPLEGTSLVASTATPTSTGASPRGRTSPSIRRSGWPSRPDYILILPWNLSDEIMAQLAYAREWGARFVVPIPEVTVHGDLPVAASGAKGGAT